METKNEIIIGEYLVVEDINGSFYVRKTYSNTKGALREIANKIDFEYDDNWNTRQFGAKLIGELKGEKIPSKGIAHAEYGHYYTEPKKAPLSSTRTTRTPNKVYAKSPGL